VRKVTVNLGERTYPVIIGREILSNIPEICLELNIPKRVAIITDKHVAGIHLTSIKNSLRHHGFTVTEIIISPGERQKSLTTTNRIVTQLLEARLPRNSAIISFGGGVVGDIAGFTAAIYRRGIMLVQVPTTLLGQVESSIGGKTAVNHPLSKNAVGAFHQPRFVFSDVAFLSTLPKREIICGLGEILKYSMLQESILTFLESHLDEILLGNPEILEDIICRCNSVKAALIEEDEKETNPSGGRAVLNLGHSVGHALEDLSKYKLHHGEAVVIGLRWELEIARAAGIIDEHIYKQYASLLNRVPYHPDISYIKREAVIKKVAAHAAGAGMVLPKGMEEIVITKEISPKIIRSVSAKFIR
jgi:3-dehydroquinate synthase